MARRTSRGRRRRRTSRPARRRRVTTNRRRRTRRTSRRTSVKRNRRGTSRRSRVGYYLHYKTPKGSKRVIRLGYNKDTAGNKLKAWQKKVRGKGYRILHVFGCGGGMMRARKLAAAAA